MSRITRQPLLGSIKNTRQTNQKNKAADILKRKPDSLSLSPTAQKSALQAPPAEVKPLEVPAKPKQPTTVSDSQPKVPTPPQKTIEGKTVVPPVETKTTVVPPVETKTPAIAKTEQQPVPETPVQVTETETISETTVAEAPKSTDEISAEGRNQMAQLLQAAEEGSGGKRPKGRCYEKVWNYICQAGYGKMPAVDVPSDYSAYARNFAEYANEGDNASQLGLRRLDIDNPYEAPPGSLVVVRPGTPGTAHPVAGDIAIVGQDGALYNDGEMSYGGSGNFPPGNDYVLGIYTPV